MKIWRGPFLLALVLISAVFILRRINDSPLASRLRLLSPGLATRYCVDKGSQYATNIYANTSAIIDGNPYSQEVISLRGQNQMIAKSSAGAGRDNFSAYLKTLLVYMIPWLVLALLTFIGCHICGLYCVCYDSCASYSFCSSCTNCCIRISNNELFTKGEAVSAMCCSLPLIPLIIAAAILGLLYSANVITGAIDTQCVMAKFVDNYQYGVNFTIDNTSLSWIGLRNLPPQIESLKAYVSQASSALAQPVNSSALDQQYSLVTDSISKVYTDNKDKTLANPNPLSSAPTINSDVLQRLGPITDPSTLGGAINAEATVKTTFVYEALNQAANYSMTLKSQPQAIIDSLNNVGNQTAFVLDASSQAEDQMEDIFSSPTIYNVSTYEAAFRCFFIVTIVVAVIIFILFLVHCISGSKLVYYPLFFIWFLSAALSIFGFILAAFVLPAGIASLEACDFIYKTFQNTQSYQNYSSLLAGWTNTTPEIETCLFGNGDLVQNVPGSFQFANLYVVKSNIDKLASIKNNLAPFTKLLVLENSTAYIQGIVQGVYPAVTPHLNDVNNPYAALATFNQYTDDAAPASFQSSASCAVTQDLWLFNQTLCPQGSTVYQLGSPRANLGPPMCLAIGSTPQSDATNRYSNPTFSNCQQTIINSSIVDSYITSLYAYFSSVNTVFNGVLSDLNNITAANDAFFAVALSVFDPVLALGNSTGELLDSASSLRSQMNCAFAAGELEDLKRGFCSETASYLLNLGAVCAALAFLLALFLIPLFCGAMRIRFQGDVGNAKTRHSRI